MKERRIYRIINLKNGKIYIGQTSLPLEERVESYKKEVEYRKYARYIIRAMRKWGMDNFLIEEIYTSKCSSRHITCKEGEYIKYYKSMDPRVGYNLTSPVEHGGHSKRTRKKIGESQRGPRNHMYGIRGKDNPGSKPTIELTTGKRFHSITEAAEHFNVSISHVASVTRGERGSTGGRVFRLIGEDGIPISEERFVKPKSLKVRKSIKEELEKYV